MSTEYNVTDAFIKYLFDKHEWEYKEEKIKTLLDSWKVYKAKIIDGSMDIKLYSQPKELGESLLGFLSKSCDGLATIDNFHKEYCYIYLHTDGNVHDIKGIFAGDLGKKLSKLKLFLVEYTKYIDMPSGDKFFQKEYGDDNENVFNNFSYIIALKKIAVLESYTKDGSNKLFGTYDNNVIKRLCERLNIDYSAYDDSDKKNELKSWIRFNHEIYQKLFDSLKNSCVEDETLRNKYFIDSNIDNPNYKKISCVIYYICNFLAWTSNDEESNLDRILKKIEPLNVILHGAPGTGKTFSVDEAVNIMSDFNERIDFEQTINDTKIKRSIKRFDFVQFHSSYDYTDFVEGLRPVSINDKMEFKKVDGIFKAFCRNVAEYNEVKGNTDTPFYFKIDEINRADLGKVFGELMFGLEKDYRGKKHKFNTQYQNVPTYFLRDKNDYPGKNKSFDINANRPDIFEDEFYIPENVHVIGTMNDIDRSVESIDFAMRRRFKWINVKVDEAYLDNVLPYICKYDSKSDKFKELKNVIIALNKAITKNGKKFNLDESYYIGPSYFRTIADDGYDGIWNDHIEPILIEYVRGRSSEDISEFVRKCKEDFFKNNK